MAQGPANIEHQERDIALLRDLFASRAMTLVHIAALHFRGRAEAAKKRLQKLKAAGLIAERPRKARDPGVLFLTREGFDLLTDRGELADYPALTWPQFERRSRVSPLTLRHELEVMDAKAALAPAVAGLSGMTVIEFSTWPLLHQFDVQTRGRAPIRVKPDGFLRVEEKGADGEVFEHAFFLEVDRGTETLDTLGRRLFAYREYYSGGGFATTFGAPRADFAQYPFRVLIVLPSDERRNNLAESLLALKPPIETQAWMTTASELRSDPLGPIWLRPRDYRDALVGAGFAEDRPRAAYRRNRQREVRVRERASLRALFTD